MSYDLTFYSRLPVDSAALQQSIRKWANAKPNIRDHGAQLEYDNPDTLVHGMFDVNDQDHTTDADDEPNDVLSGLHHTGCSANLNYLRPEFFADELTPLAADFAKAIGAVLYCPQEDAVFEPDEFIQKDPYLRHLRSVNQGFVRRKDAEPPKQVDPTLLRAFWRHNVTKTELQDRLGDDIFVPTITLVQLKGAPQPTTAMTWTRAIPMVFEETGVVILVREREGLFKSSHEIRIAPFAKFRDAVATNLQPFEGQNDKHLLSEVHCGALDPQFDRLFDELPKVKDLKDAIQTRYGDLMGIVDAIKDRGP